MENIDKVFEKLILNRTRLMMTRFDKELKDIIENDMQAFKSQNQQLSMRKRNRNVA